MLPGPPASAGRRLSLGTLRVSSSQHTRHSAANRSSSSLLFVDGTSLLTALPGDSDTPPPPRRVSGRSPRIRRKPRGTTAGKARDKRGPAAKSASSAKLQLIQTPKPAVDDWLKFELSSAVSGTAADMAADDASADEDGANGTGSLAAAAAAAAAAASSFADIGDAVSQRVENAELYAELSQLTHSVGRFTKLAYPDMHGHVVTPFKEAFYEKRFGTQR